MTLKFMPATRVAAHFPAPGLVIRERAFADAAVLVVERLLTRLTAKATARIFCFFQKQGAAMRVAAIVALADLRHCVDCVIS
jgi:hypothetical protein